MNLDLMAYKFKSILKKNYYFLVIIFLFINIFTRGYKAVERFNFAHDGDLYSWIVKDIVVNRHLRLIGQETSTQGIFVGPLFYYLITPFFLLTNMSPTGVLIFASILALFTAVSFLYVFNNLFGKTAGLIALILQTILMPRILHDRWVVPTILESIWDVWYFFCIVKLLKGEFKFLWLLGLLVALMWHINLSLAPLLLLIPLSIYLSKKRISKKDIGGFLIFFISASLPLILFELKHNFSQSKHFIQSFIINQGQVGGFDKFMHVLFEATWNLTYLFSYPIEIKFEIRVVISLLIFLCAWILVKRKRLSLQNFLIFLFWVMSVVAFFSLSSKIISEYYFANLELIFLAIIILSFTALIDSPGFGSVIAFILLTFLIGKNLYFFIFKGHYNQMGYLERKQTVEYIAKDASLRGYPCVSISYLTTPGNDLGFRYFFYLQKIHVNQPKSQSPNYTIVLPWSLSTESAKVRFGPIGVIDPDKSYTKDEVSKSCSGQNSNLTDPLFGYVE